MKIGETKVYKGKSIKMVGRDKFVVPGFINYFRSYYEAKDGIDACISEDIAMKEIDAYVRDVLGGYM